MYETIHSVFSFLLDLVVVPRRTERVVRNLAPNTLRALAAAHNRHNGEYTSLLPYHEERVTALVWEVKYYKNRRAVMLAGELLSETLLAIASESLGKPLLVPIPMHPTRRKERGHNQTEVLCESTFNSTFEYSPNALIRTKNTSPQQGLAKHSRLGNVKNSMHVAHPELVGGRTCIVVDDVATTGATFAEARRALMAAGAQSVECVALAGS